MSRGSTVILVALAVALLAGCSSPWPRRDPTGARFPSIRGTALDGTQVAIPEDLAGGPAILFVGYEMETQFDIDRWLLALVESGVEAPVLELPTIAGLVPGLFAGQIDEGMRSGIPSEDWAAVVTIYDDAEIVQRALGSEVPLPARVLVLDAEGTVVYFHDRGFSTRAFIALRSALAEASGDEEAANR